MFDRTDVDIVQSQTHSAARVSSNMPVTTLSMTPSNDWCTPFDLQPDILPVNNGTLGYVTAGVLLVRVFEVEGPKKLEATSAQ